MDILARILAENRRPGETPQQFRKRTDKLLKKLKKREKEEKARGSKT